MRADCMLVIALALAAPQEIDAAAQELWVSPTGSDANPGSPDEPLQTPAAALHKSREMRRTQATDSGIDIVFRGGVYPMSAPLGIRPEDSGTEAAPTVLRAAPGESPVFSGGVVLGGWRKLEDAVPGLSAAAAQHVWVARVPEFRGRALEFRQMWVNHRKAVRAREPDGATMARLTGWNRERHIASIPKRFSGRFRHIPDVEMTVLQMWEIANLRLASLQVGGESALATFQEPEGRLEFEHPWPQPLMEPHGAPFFLTGAIELLDQPGEWRLDRRAGRVYYWPREGEDLTTAHVVVPALETLVTVSGSLDRPVEHIAFRGLSFQHTTWVRPSRMGHVPLQAGMYLTEAYKLKPRGTPECKTLDNQAWVGRPPAAVLVEGAHHTNFHRCRFEHLASAGLDYRWGTQDDLIEGCLFQEIGGNGVQMGSFQEGGVETHLAYAPQDEREVCSRERLSNNLVTDCANEDWGCVGIGVGYANSVTIEHNEVSNVSYTGVSLGWGWTRNKNALRNNRVVANHIHHVATRMSDTACIYTLSAQPGTVIADNYVHSITMSPYVHDPEHWFYLYLDEGSSFIKVTNNWCP
ncbi:MAG: right-handed parallel beta-helix repeat-containing protein, partial [Planctomycetales bacterium]|nr:right-handed parallel beta-helix repeat-containing protein [Planctomycetales bacterium]